LEGSLTWWNNLTCCNPTQCAK